MDREAVHRTLKELTSCAEQRGLALAGVHDEGRASERLTTWATLILDCRNEGVTKIVVPSPDHFHEDAAVAAFMRAELAERIDGAVLYASEPPIGEAEGHHGH
jgi:hypothetical protein